VTATGSPSIPDTLQGALLRQARLDLMAGNHEACGAKLNLLLKDMPWDAAATAVCTGMMLALATDAVHEAANLAFYLSGGVPSAVRSAAVRDTFDGLAGWERLPALIASLGFDRLPRDPAALIGRLGSIALPREDPAWAGTPTGRAAASNGPLVVVSLVNGMGNQLFQYAAGLRRARASGGVLKFDLSLFATEGIGTRPFALDDFAIDVPRASAEDMVRVAAHGHVDNLTQVDAALMNGRGDCRLVGCWPNPLYSRGVETELRETLRLRDPALAQRTAAKVTALRRRGPVIGMHVRRGDYLAPVYRNAFAPLPVEYFRAALRRFPDERIVVVFSDTPEDREWCAAAFADLGDTMEVSCGRSDIEDFALLAACDHQIISASSFSWWAAWLNPNPSKQVIAPHPALGRGPRNAHFALAGRVPSDWFALSRDDLE
jgi:Glycosyl transferase family 11